MTKIARNSVVLLATVIWGIDGRAEESHALLIANWKYAHWQELKTPEGDIDSLDKILRDEYGFITRVMKNVTSAEIIDEVEHYKERLTPEDNLLIYFAGHGILRADGGYWVGVDGTQTSRADWLKYQVVEDLIDYRAGMNALHVIVVADSCYSGAALRSAGVIEAEPTNDRSEWLARMNDRRSRTVLTSGGTEPVIDNVGNSAHSIFASELLDKLERNAEVLDGYGLFSSIKVEVHGRAARILGTAAQAPEYGALPGVGHDGGDFLFIPIGVAPPAPVTGPTAPMGNFGIKGATQIVHQNPSTIHIGDEDITSWAPKVGACYDLTFSYEAMLEMINLNYDVFGAEATFVEFGSTRYPFEAQIPKSGQTRPNYWDSGRSFRIPVGQTIGGPIPLRICSRTVDHPEFPGDLDDFQVRNLTITVN